jgi:amidase
MSDQELCFFPASDVFSQFKKGILSPVELTQAIIHRIEDINPQINAFTYTYFERAIKAAREAEKIYKKENGKIRPLEGIPVVIKDSTAIQGEISTSGSKIYENHRPDYTHPGAERLLNAGAILLARTTMPEFGEAGNCYTPLWGVTRNPWNLDYGPGGSSGGAGAAVASGMTTLSDGSDIGGSIRIPAACCGVVGYKPPYGRNPNDHLSSFDPYLHYGPITRTVRDAALMQNIISGIHPADIGTVREDITIPDDLGRIKGWKIAYSYDLGFYQVDKDVRNNMENVLNAFESLGCQVEPVDLGWSEDVFEAWKIINSVRGSAAKKVKDLEKWRAHMADYTVDWLDVGAKVEPGQIADAYDIQRAMYDDMGPLLEEYDIFVCPTNAIPSVEAARSPLDLDFNINDEPARPVVAEAWFMTYPFNILSQLPVMSVPSGFAANGVPTGVQLVSRSYDDIRVFKAASALEKEIGWPGWRPPI